MQIDRYIAPPGARAPGLFERPVWGLGFRPFFLLAGAFAALWLVLWLLALFVARLPLAASGADWHAHEMVFGFGVAVLAGFLLTAARNWTKQRTPTGGRLAGLALLWLLGRLVMLVGARLPGWLVATVDVAFLPVFALFLALPLWRAGSRRNYPFVALLLALGGVNVLFHLEPLLRLWTMTVAVEVMVVFLVVMGGRVIPFFTRNALPGARVRSWPWLDALAIASSVAYPLVQLGGLGRASDLVALLAAASNLARLAGWDSLRTRRAPILWVLHLGYLWIGVGYLLLGLGRWVPALYGSAPLHALTVGALGTLTLGMMARVSLGHTGRPLTLPRSMSVAFGLVTVGALARVVLPLASPHLLTGALVVSGIAWSCAFALFVAVYWPILTRPRVDGAPG
ncbi:MAG: NnrS family protein [Myxococcales bacterium]|nr:NnrS family protein [Myxococcales bacterium]MCB9736762.1 NnrS family protein [Deltaproteobacteria bacterium]